MTDSQLVSSVLEAETESAIRKSRQKMREWEGEVQEK